VAGSGLSPYQPGTPTQPLPTAAPTTAAPTTAPPTTAAPTPTVPPIPPDGVFLTGDGTTDDSGSVGANATWVNAAGMALAVSPASGYPTDPTFGHQVFSFDGSDGLTDPYIPQLTGSTFTVAFDLNTIQSTGSTAIDLLGYRASCGPSNFFDVRLQSSTGDPGGAADGPDHVLVELAQPGGSPVNLRSPSLPTGPLNVGGWHQIMITRNGTTVTLWVGGKSVDTEQVPAGVSYQNGAAWQVANGDVCDPPKGHGGDGTQPLQGEMADIFVSPIALSGPDELP
jgi:hypothetical protein